MARLIAARLRRGGDGRRRSPTGSPSPPCPPPARHPDPAPASSRTEGTRSAKRWASWSQTNYPRPRGPRQAARGAHAGQRLGDWLAVPVNVAPRRRGRGRRGAWHRCRCGSTTATSATALERLVASGCSDRPSGRSSAGRSPGDGGWRPGAAARPVLLGARRVPRTTVRRWRTAPAREPVVGAEPIDDRIFNKIFTGVQSFLTDVHDAPQPRGAPVDQRAPRPSSPDRLREDPELAKRGEAMKDEAPRPPGGPRLARAACGGTSSAPPCTPRRTPTASCAGGSTRRSSTSARGCSTDLELQAKVDEWLVRHRRATSSTTTTRGRRPDLDHRGQVTGRRPAGGWSCRSAATCSSSGSTDVRRRPRRWRSTGSQFLF